MSYLFFVVADPYFIQPLSPNPLVVKYLHPVSLSFQVAALSNGIDNRVRGIFLVRPGSREPLGISSTTSNSQVFTEELGPAVSQTSGNYTACEHILLARMQLFITLCNF